MRLLDATLASMFAILVPAQAFACCSYGCCDCSCVAAVPDEDAKRIIDEIASILARAGYDPKTIDLTVRHEDGLIVLQKDESGSIGQPASEQVK